MKWSHGLILGFLTFICIEMALVHVATSNFDGPDDPNYYKMGMEYSQEVDRRKAQHELGWTLRCQADGQTMLAIAQDPSGHPVDGKLVVFAKRPATKRFDSELKTHFDGVDYRADWKPERGVWDLDFDLEARGQHFKTTRRMVVR